MIRIAFLSFSIILFSANILLSQWENKGLYKELNFNVAVVHDIKLDKENGKIYVMASPINSNPHLYVLDFETGSILTDKKIPPVKYFEFGGISKNMKSYYSLSFPGNLVADVFDLNSDSLIVEYKINNYVNEFGKNFKGGLNYDPDNSTIDIFINYVLHTSDYSIQGFLHRYDLKLNQDINIFNESVINYDKIDNISIFTNEEVQIYGTYNNRSFSLIIAKGDSLKTIYNDRYYENERDTSGRDTYYDFLTDVHLSKKNTIYASSAYNNFFEFDLSGNIMNKINLGIPVNKFLETAFDKVFVGIGYYSIYFFSAKRQEDYYKLADNQYFSHIEGKDKDFIASTNSGTLYKFSLDTNLLHVNENINKEFEVFPNPASDIICFNLNDALEIPVKVDIVNCMGEVVLSQNIAKDDGLIRIFLQKLPTGTYFIRAYKNGKFFGSRFVKIHD